MNITVVPGGQLSANHLRAWAELQRAEPALSSPFLCPEFTQAVAAVRNDVYVAVFEDSGLPVGFFPFQNGPHGKGRPVGAEVNDLQGLIASAAFPMDLRKLLRACGLVQWEFSRLLAFQRPFERAHVRRHSSGMMDLSRGYDAYLEARSSAGIGHRKTRQLARKLERERGPLRFELHCADSSPIATLMGWKFDLYRGLGYSDVFQERWIRHLVEGIHSTQTPHFGGLLSLLYSGDELVAGHMGMRSRSLLHHWFPAFNPQFAHYSPGMVLMLEIAKQAPTVGVRHIELGGYDDYPYKQRLMTHSIELAEGIAHVLPGVAATRRATAFAEGWIRRSPRLRPAARMIARAFRGMRRLLA